jgi:hypothetical protein
MASTLGMGRVTYGEVGAMSGLGRCRGGLRDRLGGLLFKPGQQIVGCDGSDGTWWAAGSVPWSDMRRGRSSSSAGSWLALGESSGANL